MGHMTAVELNWQLVIREMEASEHMVSLLLQASLGMFKWWLCVPRDRVEMIKVS